MKVCNTYWVKIHIAGDINIIKNTCRKFCWCGLCVSVKSELFIYTGGQEDGALIELINYPRFEESKQNILKTAVKLAMQLKKDANQWSVLIMTPNKTYWISDRKDK